MTLDEAIEKEKLVAVSYCDMATACHTNDNIYSKEEESYRAKAEYYAQIAEWLSELKQLRKQLKKQESILDKIREDIVDTLYVDSLIFGELIDFKNGKISADDVIEEFNRVTKIEVLQIIDKYKAESKPKESEKMTADDLRAECMGKVQNLVEEYIKRLDDLRKEYDRKIKELEEKESE